MSAFFLPKISVFWLSCVRYFLVLFSVFVRWKVTINRNISFTNCASGIRLLDCSKLAVNWKNVNDVKIFRDDVIVNFFDVVLFLLSSLVTGPSFMSTSSLLLELWQFLFIRDWPEIRKSEISSVWDLPSIWRLGQVRKVKFGMNVSNKIYWMLQNVRVTAFTVSELLRENYPPPRVSHRC